MFQADYFYQRLSASFVRL